MASGISSTRKKENGLVKGMKHDALLHRHMINALWALACRSYMAIKGTPDASSEHGLPFIGYSLVRDRHH